MDKLSSDLHDEFVLVEPSQTLNATTRLPIRTRNIQFVVQPNHSLEPSDEDVDIISSPDTVVSLDSRSPSPCHLEESPRPLQKSKDDAASHTQKPDQKKNVKQQRRPKRVLPRRWLAYESHFPAVPGSTFPPTPFKDHVEVSRQHCTSHLDCDQHLISMLIDTALDSRMKQSNKAQTSDYEHLRYLMLARVRSLDPEHTVIKEITSNLSWGSMLLPDQPMTPTILQHLYDHFFTEREKDILLLLRAIHSLHQGSCLLTTVKSDDLASATIPTRERNMRAKDLAMQMIVGCFQDNEPASARALLSIFRPHQGLNEHVAMAALSPAPGSVKALCVSLAWVIGFENQFSYMGDPGKGSFTSALPLSPNMHKRASSEWESNDKDWNTSRPTKRMSIPGAYPSDPVSEHATGSPSVQQKHRCEIPQRREQHIQWSREDDRKATDILGHVHRTATSNQMTTHTTHTQGPFSNMHTFMSLNQQPRRQGQQQPSKEHPLDEFQSQLAMLQQMSERRYKLAKLGQQNFLLPLRDNTATSTSNAQGGRCPNMTQPMKEQPQQLRRDYIYAPPPTAQPSIPPSQQHQQRQPKGNNIRIDYQKEVWSFEQENVIQTQQGQLIDTNPHKVSDKDLTSKFNCSPADVIMWSCGGEVTLNTPFGQFQPATDNVSASHSSQFGPHIKSETSQLTTTGTSDENKLWITTQEGTVDIISCPPLDEIAVTANDLARINGCVHEAPSTTLTNGTLPASHHTPHTRCAICVRNCVDSAYERYSHVREYMQHLRDVHAAHENHSMSWPVYCSMCSTRCKDTKSYYDHVEACMTDFVDKHVCDCHTRCALIRRALTAANVGRSLSPQVVSDAIRMVLHLKRQQLSSLPCMSAYRDDNVQAARRDASVCESAGSI